MSSSREEAIARLREMGGRESADQRLICWKGLTFNVTGRILLDGKESEVCVVSGSDEIPSDKSLQGAACFDFQKRAGFAFPSLQHHCETIPIAPEQNRTRRKRISRAQPLRIKCPQRQLTLLEGLS